MFTVLDTHQCGPLRWLYQMLCVHAAFYVNKTKTEYIIITVCHNLLYHNEHKNFTTRRRLVI